MIAPKKVNLPELTETSLLPKLIWTYMNLTKLIWTYLRDAFHIHVATDSVIMTLVGGWVTQGVTCVTFLPWQYEYFQFRKFRFYNYSNYCKNDVFVPVRRYKQLIYLASSKAGDFPDISFYRQKRILLISYFFLFLPRQKLHLAIGVSTFDIDFRYYIYVLWLHVVK